MIVQAIYNGFGLATIQARMGVGERVVNFKFDPENEPEVNSVVEMDVNANERDEITLAQEKAYKLNRGA